MIRDSIPESYSPQAIWFYYERSQEALIALSETLRLGARRPLTFEEMTWDAIQDALVALRDELDDQVTLTLVASFEAAIRMDFNLRANRRSKSRVLRNECAIFAQQYPRGVPFEDILDLWVHHSGKQQVISQLKQLYNYRHWLAHGRYWTQKSGLRNVDPEDAWNIGEQFFKANPEIGVQL